MSTIKYVPSSTKDKYLRYQPTLAQGDCNGYAMFTLLHPSTGKPHGVEVRWAGEDMTVTSAPWTWQFVRRSTRNEFFLDFPSLQNKVNDAWINGQFTRQCSEKNWDRMIRKQQRELELA